MSHDSHEVALASDWLVFFYFQYGKNKDHTKEGGWKEDLKGENTGRGTYCTCRTPSTGRTSSTWCGGPSKPGWDREEGVEAEQLEEVGRSLESSPTWQLAQMAVEAGPSTSGGEELARRKLWLTVGGKAPWKEFLKARKVKMPWRYWPGTVALCKICQFQKSTDLPICKLPLSHLVHEIALEVGCYDMHFQVHAILTLQEAAEAYLAGLLEDANLYTIHVKCITIMPKDIQLPQHIHWEHLHY